MREVIKKKWDYILYEVDGKFVLSVLCGTVGLFETNIVLNDEECQKYKYESEKFLEDFSAKIRYSPNSYSPRHIDLKTLQGDK